MAEVESNTNAILETLMSKACFQKDFLSKYFTHFTWVKICRTLTSLYHFENLNKQHQIIAELKQEEATIICQMKQSPKEFEPKNLRIKIDCYEPYNIAAGMGYNIKNEPSVIQRPAQNISKPALSVQKEPFQKYRRSYFYSLQIISKNWCFSL